SALQKQAGEAAHGSGDQPYWSRSAKHLALQFARQACLSATVCDGPMLGALQPALRRSLQTAGSFAFDGRGDVEFWRHQTKAMSRTADCMRAPLKPFETTLAAAEPSSMQRRLLRLNADHLNSLEQLTFQYQGHDDDWRKRARLVAFRAAAHSAD